MPALHVKRYLITGLLAFIPVWITWVVFEFVFTLLAGVGAPLVNGIIGLIGLGAPVAAQVLHRDWVVSILAFVLTLLALYVLGWLSTKVLGRRVLGAVDALLERIPLVHTIYGGVKKLMTLMRKKPGGTQRVVLIDFPSPELKSIGFVTRTFVDAAGCEVAAVYVPTTPNPTGGYLELVPTERLVATDWTIDQAMAFLVSGGAVGPEQLPAVSPAPAPLRAPVETTGA
ncbi:MAG TPA: DUF502 domain-containing protein [Rhodanobacteraceae bacterium]|jgi:uncharacterized membrane protein|nr:DUF502 domain-containing protein [Rhodanobacteraceae bacterium]